jgi:hypothetical protein
MTKKKDIQKEEVTKSKRCLKEGVSEGQSSLAKLIRNMKSQEEEEAKEKIAIEKIAIEKIAIEKIAIEKIPIIEKISRSES